MKRHLPQLTPGKHKLTVSIQKGTEPEGSLVYFLMKDANGLRIVHKKYEYRLDAVKQETNFDTVMQDENISKEIREILEHSLIAKEGDSSYYFEGDAKTFMNGEELIAVQKGSYGKLLLPLSQTLNELGADFVSMSSGKDITIVYNNEKSMIMAGSGIVRRGFMITRLNGQVVLYLNKTMAGGEFYQCITGRNWIEANGLIIILPDGETPDKASGTKLLDAATKLFQS